MNAPLKEKRKQTTLMIEPEEYERFKRIAESLNMSAESLMETLVLYAADDESPLPELEEV